MLWLALLLCAALAEEAACAADDAASCDVPAAPAKEEIDNEGATKILKGPIRKSLERGWNALMEKLHEKEEEIYKKMTFQKQKETCIPGIFSSRGVYNVVEDLLQNDLLGELKIVLDSTKCGKVFRNAQGKPRTVENYIPVFNRVREALKDDDMYFPDTLTSDTVLALLKSNPFVTMGLSYEKGKFVWNASHSSKNPLTRAIMRPLHYTGAKMWLSADLSEVTLEVQDRKFKEGHPEFNTHLRAFITPLLYFFEMVHASLHVYTYTMMNAAEYATFETSFAEYVKTYEHQIFLKYQEVALVLLKPEKGALTGKQWKGVSSDHALEAASEVFKLLAKQKSAKDWYENVFCAGIPQIIDNDEILPQAKPYVPIVSQLGKKILDASKDSLGEEKYYKELDKIHGSLEKYFNRVDGALDSKNMFGISTLSDWIECQNMAGILHGNTLGLTRLLFTQYLVFDGNWDSKKIDPDFSQLTTAVGTMMGLDEKRAILQNDLLKDTIFHDSVKNFKEAADKIQANYWDNLSKEQKMECGWIHSVWGPNMVDSTQLTCNTYV